MSPLEKPVIYPGRTSILTRTILIWFECKVFRCRDGAIYDQTRADR
jgi:hypothetical protein